MAWYRDTAWDALTQQRARYHDRNDALIDLDQERRDRRQERADETATVHVLYDAHRTGNVFAFPADPPGPPTVAEQRALHLRLLDLDRDDEIRRSFLPRTPPDRVA